jgi:two-component system chemotaxis sensor kinase CheA
MAAGDQDVAREEFLAEAQELVETLSRDLLQLEQEQRDGAPSADLLNDLFRGVHTLKGLSGMFDFRELGRLAHAVEDLLDQLRMDRVALNQPALDLLFQGVEGFARCLASQAEPGAAAPIDVEAFTARVRGLTATAGAPARTLADYALDRGTLAVLTEYEEHRLRSLVARGHALYRLVVELPLDALEAALDELKRRAQPLSEIVSLLPSQEAQREGMVAVELLLASTAKVADLTRALSLEGAELHVVPRRAPPVEAARAAAPRPPVPRAAAPAPAPAPAPAAAAPRAATETPSTAPPPGAALAPRGDQLSLRSLTSVVRVDIRKLDHLMNAVGELGTLRSAVAKLIDKLRAGASRTELALEAQRVHRSLDRRLSVVQDAVLEVRMVPLSQLFEKLAVVVRQLGREQGKRVQLVVRGAETEVDKLIAEEIADPLVHLVRNAVDHGLEGEAERGARQKPAVGLVTIHAYQKGNHVVVEVKDDGRGIDPRALRSTAVARGLIGAQRAGEMSDREALEVVFLPGFSTSLEVSDVSGRGVGMDVVRTNVQRLGGSVEVSSELGRGATFAITLPITLAIIGALLFLLRGRTMAIPLAAVSEVVRVEPKMLRQIDGRDVLDLRGTTLPLCRLGEQLRLRSGEAPDKEQHAIVLSVGNRRLGVLVDRLLAQQDVVIKPLGKSLSGVRGLVGATDLGDQRLVLVLDAATLLDEVFAVGNAMPVAGGAA